MHYSNFSALNTPPLSKGTANIHGCPNCICGQDIPQVCSPNYKSQQFARPIYAVCRGPTAPQRQIYGNAGTIYYGHQRQPSRSSNRSSSMSGVVRRKSLADAVVLRHEVGRGLPDQWMQSTGPKSINFVIVRQEPKLIGARSSEGDSRAKQSPNRLTGQHLRGQNSKDSVKHEKIYLNNRDASINSNKSNQLQNKQKPKFKMNIVSSNRLPSTRIQIGPRNKSPNHQKLENINRFDQASYHIQRVNQQQGTVRMQREESHKVIKLNCDYFSESAMSDRSISDNIEL